MQFRVGQRFLRRCASRVKLDFSKGEEQALANAKALAFEHFQRVQKNIAKGFDLNDIRKQLKAYDIDLPQKPSSKDVSKAWKELYEKRPDHEVVGWEAYDIYFKLSRELIHLEEVVDEKPITLDSITQEFLESAEAANLEDRKIALKVLEQIEAAASRADIPNGIPITLTDTQSVQVGPRGVTFTLFIDKETGKIEQIEDILEGGDTDFFDGPQGPTLAKAYFDLIKEIKHPGSSQTGKDILLYTARPVKDRRQFEGARTLPPNLFLANSLDHVEGLANDLGGGTKRDVWKVRINTRYLVLTNDAGRVKYYQIVGDKPVPVQNLELIIPAEEA
jgi:hypothetical protein